MSDINAITGGAPSSVLSGKGAKFADNPFLSMLIAEMRTQNPLSPMENGDFMQQMSQFSSMEEQKQLNTNLLALLEFQGTLARLGGLSQGATLIGKEVQYQHEDSAETSSGMVESVRVDENGRVLLKIGEKEIEMGQVVGINGAKKDTGTGVGKDDLAQSEGKV
jgi:flagellar basal-body rod modification protein FlgD